MDSRTINQAAKRLYGVSIGHSDTEQIDYFWAQQSDTVKQGWVRVAEFVADMLGQYMIMYGYNGKEEFHGLDEMISPPDHR